MFIFEVYAPARSWQIGGEPTGYFRPSQGLSPPVGRDGYSNSDDLEDMDNFDDLEDMDDLDDMEGLDDLDDLDDAQRVLRTGSHRPWSAHNGKI